jgi:hypothetical protein
LAGLETGSVTRLAVHHGGDVEPTLDAVRGFEERERDSGFQIVTPGRALS